VPDQVSRFALSSAALDRMLSVAEENWEATHGHPAPCPPDCPIHLQAEADARDIRAFRQPIPSGRTAKEELARSHGAH